VSRALLSNPFMRRGLNSGRGAWPPPISEISEEELMGLDLEKYRKKLIWERDELGGEVGSVAEIAGGIPSDSDQDMAEVAQHGPVTDVEKQVVNLKSDRLERINAALQRIDEGTYGTCDACGEQIDPRRLDAEPTAMTCMNHLPPEEENFNPPKM
jgi:DnaK suppressor protein